MTLFIIFIATTNLALGYAMAVYMGHSKSSGRPRLPAIQEREEPDPVEDVAEEPESDTSPVEELANDSESLPEQTPLESNDESVESSSADPIEAVHTPEEPPTPEIAEVEIPKTPLSDEPAKGTESSEEVVGSTVIDETQPPETSVVENEVDEIEPQESPPEVAENEQLPPTEPAVVESESEKPAEIDELETSESLEESREPTDEKVLEGLESFQNQLNESTPEESEEATTEPSSGEVATTEEKSAPTSTKDDAEEMLAGIEAFRAQLADMQGTGEASAEKLDDDAAIETEKTAEVVSEP